MSSNDPRSYICVQDVNRNITMADEKLTILNQVSFNLERGQSAAIIGESGSGKSTLLGLLAGLDIPDAGQIFIDNKDLCQMDEDGRAALRAQYMGFVFQSFQLMPSYTALENVMLPIELKGNISNATPRASELLDRVGLSHRLTHYPHQLSGGEQQRVALARAFVNTPEILFADEPTGNLDSKTSEIITDLMFELNREHQTTLILVTHENTLAQRCQRTLQLRDCQIHED